MPGFMETVSKKLCPAQAIFLKVAKIKKIKRNVNLFVPQLSHLPFLALLSSGYPKGHQAEHHNYRSRVT